MMGDGNGEGAVAVSAVSPSSSPSPPPSKPGQPEVCNRCPAALIQHRTAQLNPLRNKHTGRAVPRNALHHNALHLCIGRAVPRNALHHSAATIPQFSAGMVHAPIAAGAQLI